jgi:hypothetical protein
LNVRFLKVGLYLSPILEHSSENVPVSSVALPLVLSVTVSSLNCSVIMSLNLLAVSELPVSI